MLAFLKRLLGLETPSAQRLSNSSAESRTPAQALFTSQGSSGEYFTTLGKLQQAISSRDYQRAASLARENMRQIPALVKTTEREYGSFDIPSIPVFQQGGTMLALVEIKRV